MKMGILVQTFQTLQRIEHLIQGDFARRHKNVI